MSLEEIKEQYAKDLGLNDFKHFRKSFGDKSIESAMSQIAERYAQQRVNEVLDNAAEIIGSGCCQSTGLIKNIKKLKDE